MSQATRKPNKGDTVLVKESDQLTYEGIVEEVLSSQFTYRVHAVNNRPAPTAPTHRWIRYCFYADEWRIKPRAIDDFDKR